MIRIFVALKANNNIQKRFIEVKSSLKEHCLSVCHMCRHAIGGMKSLLLVPAIHVLRFRASAFSQ